MYPVQNHTQLFVDDFLIARKTGLVRTMHSPEKYEGNPIMVPELPFERRYQFHYTWDNGSVIHDPDGGLFHAYWSQVQKHTLYAVSEDGIHWSKPRLGRVPYDGDTQNNILFEDVSAATVAYNPIATTDRFLMLSKGRHSMHCSRNGRDWKPVDASLDWGRMSDSGACVYDPYRAQYIMVQKRRYPIGAIVVNPLTAEEWDVPVRVLGLVTSHDGTSWTAWREALRPDDFDHKTVAERYPGIFVEGFLYPWRMRPEFKAAHEMAIKTRYLERLTVPPQTGFHHLEFMNMVILPYHNLYVGLLQVLNTTAQVIDFGAKGLPRADSPGQDGTMEVQLVGSRDLVKWERFGERKPFIPLGPVDSWDQSMLMPFTTNHIVRDGKLWIYYGGSHHSHRPNSMWNKPGDYPSETQGLGLATLREDGFVSLDAGDREGEVVTVPMIATGSRLHVNANAADGELRVEVLDENQRPLPGFELASCTPIGDDSIDHKVCWGDRYRLDQLNGRSIQLRFRLRRASLFAFRVE